MHNNEKFVQGDAQEIAEVLGRPEESAISGIPPAEGSEREILITLADQLVVAETFRHQSFADFVMTMRELVGLAEPIRPNVPSNGIPTRGLGVKNGYLEFNGEGNDANIAIVRQARGYRRGFERRSLFLKQWPEPDSFGLKMATWPAYDSDIPGIIQLFKIDCIGFAEEEDPPYNGKGGIVWTKAPLSAITVQNFCRKIVEQLHSLLSNYPFVPGEVIDERSNTLRRRLSDRYFRYTATR